MRSRNLFLHVQERGNLDKRKLNDLPTVIQVAQKVAEQGFLCNLSMAMQTIIVPYSISPRNKVFAHWQVSTLFRDAAISSLTGCHSLGS